MPKQHPQTPTTRLKIAIAHKRLPSRKWALSPDGKEHFLFAHSKLPVGWIWGRNSLQWDRRRWKQRDPRQWVGY